MSPRLALRLAGLLLGENFMIVYIDGENVVHQLVELVRQNNPNGTRKEISSFDLRKLLVNILRIVPDELDIRYYTTTLRLVRADPILEKKSREMMHWSEAWANHLVSQGIGIVKAGKLKVRDGEVCPRCGYQEAVFREKGVDVRLAVDLVVDSAQQRQLVIWSSDADLLPAVQVAKRNGARIKNITSQAALNWALAKQCGEWQTYSLADLEVKK
jgi:uncharacterized LabA/DUF88 family protein